jgi:hypothetical protein
LLTGNTNTPPVNVDYDNFKAWSITSGLEKTIPSGSAVEVANKAYVGFI